MYAFYRWQDVSRLISLDELPHLVSTQSQLIDLRSADAFDQFHIHGFICRPVAEIQNWIWEIDRYRPVYFICEHGRTAYDTAVALHAKGYQAYAFSGGITQYQLLNKSDPAFF